MRYNDFRLPKIYIAKTDGKPDLTKKWYVYFYAVNQDGVMQRVIKWGDINKHTTYRKRVSEAKILCEAIRQELISGWNPFGNRSHHSLESAINFAFDEKVKNIGAAQIAAYTTLRMLLFKYAKRHYFLDNPIEDITEAQLTRFLESNSKNWTNNTFNSRLKDLRSLFNVMIKRGIIDRSPARLIDKKKAASVQKNIPLTEDEQRRVVEYFKEKDYRYYMFLAFFYHSGFRPNEILSVRRCDIDLESRSVYLFSEDSKTDIQRVSVLPDVFVDEFSQYLEGIKPNEYVWGSEVRFAPSVKRATRNALTRKWQRHVNKNLGIPKQMYSIRHKSAADKYQDGIDVAAIQSFLGHSRITTTQIYLRSIVAYQKQVIKEKSRAF